MAIPPIVDSGIKPEDMMPNEASVDVSVPQPENFEGGAEVIDDGQGGAMVQALMEVLGGEMETQLDHEANLPEA